MSGLNFLGVQANMEDLLGPWDAAFLPSCAEHDLPRLLTVMVSATGTQGLNTSERGEASAAAWGSGGR